MSSVDRAERLLGLVRRHAELESREDWEGALATMTPDGHYELYPLGLRIEGAEAITELWKRLTGLACFAGPALASGRIREWATDDAVVNVADWSFPGADGTPRPARLITSFRFSGHAIASEVLHVDTGCEPYVAAALSGTFETLPGVTPVTAAG
jgi:hypothetical protein